MTILFRSLLIIFSVAFFISCNHSTNTTDAITVAEARDTSAYGKKLAELSEKIIANPSDASLLNQRAKLYLEKHDVGNAIIDAQKLLTLDTTNSDYFVTVANVHFAAGKSGRSKAALEKALSIDPKNKDANMKLAELYLYVQKYDQSISYLNNVLKEDIHNPKAYFMKGMTFKEMGDSAKAISSFQTAIEQQPDYYEPFMQLGIIYTMKNNPLALQYFDGAIRINSRSEEALYGRAMWYQEHAHSFDKAIQDYTTITQINPNNKNAHFNLGYVHYYYLKVYREAIKHYTNAINADPNYVDAYYNRGVCFETLGDIAAAKKDFEKSLEIRPDYEAAKEGIQRVK